MNRFSAISSLFLLGTTFAFLAKSWLAPNSLNTYLEEDDVHLYL